MRGARRRPLTTETALQYRDGLILAAWAVRPYRLSNFAMLTLDDSLLVTGTAATIIVHTTKNGNGHTPPWPPVLFEPLQTYHRVYRAYLQAGRPDAKRSCLDR